MIIKKIVLSTALIALLSVSQLYGEEPVYQDLNNTHIITFTEGEQKITELYVAVFDRAPDAEGLHYWDNSGLPIELIMSSFFEQIETQEKYPDGTENREFVYAIYQNLFQREPDVEGWNYWVQSMENGSMTRGHMILAVLNGSQGDDRVMLDNKSKVGLAFVNSGLSDYDLSREIMSGINYDQSTVESAYSKMNFDGKLEPEPNDPEPEPNDPDPDPNYPEPNDPEPEPNHPDPNYPEPNHLDPSNNLP